MKEGEILCYDRAVTVHLTSNPDSPTMQGGGKANLEAPDCWMLYKRGKIITLRQECLLGQVSRLPLIVCTYVYKKLF